MSGPDRRPLRKTTDGLPERDAVCLEAAISPEIPPELASKVPRVGWGPWLLSSLGLIAAAAVFLPVLANDFVNWDDVDNFLRNPHFRGLGGAQIRWAWSTHRLGVYQPLAWILLEAEYAAFGLLPGGYHLVSLVLHAANALVLLVLTTLLLDRAGPAEREEPAWVRPLAVTLAASLFMTHPLRVEVVAWVSCQPYLPCSLFAQLATIAYVQAHPRGRPTRWGWLIGAWGLFAIALLFKAPAVALPLVFLALDFYPLRRIGGTEDARTSARVRVAWLEKIPFAILSLAFMALAISAKKSDHSLATMARAGIGTRLAQACYGVWFYLVKTAWPSGLSAYYPLPPGLRLTSLRSAACALAILIVTGTLLVLRQSRPGLLAAWVAYLALLAPNLGLVRIGNQVAADRYCYMASLVLAVVATQGFRELLQGERRRRLALAVMILLGPAVYFVLAARTYRQCRFWRDSESLWTQVVANSPQEVPLAYLNLGEARTRQGRLPEALAFYTKAVNADPGYAEAYTGMGAVLGRSGRLDEAIACHSRAVRLRPEYAEGHCNLGTALARRGRLEAAIHEFTQALELDPEFPEAHNNLGMALLQKGDPGSARAHFEAALGLNPEYPDAHHGLGVSLARQGRLVEAGDEFARVLRLDPRHGPARAARELVLRSIRDQASKQPSTPGSGVRTRPRPVDGAEENPRS